MQYAVQLRQDRSVHVGEILLVPSPDEGGGHQGDETENGQLQKKMQKKNKEKLTRKKKNKNDILR